MALSCRTRVPVQGDTPTCTTASSFGQWPAQGHVAKIRKPLACYLRLLRASENAHTVRHWRALTGGTLPSAGDRRNREGADFFTPVFSTIFPTSPSSPFSAFV